MAYTIQYNSGGNASNSFSIADGTLNTTNTSLSLPGRNYAGYGSPVDQGLVDLTQNFARFTTGPTNSTTGQIWYDYANSTLKFNTSANSTPTWTPLVVSSNTTNVVFGNVTISNTLTTNNITTGANTTPGTITGNWSLTAGSILNLDNLSGNITTSNITTGGANIAGTITGNWTLTANSRLNATYADLAERFEADISYDYGTVLELGGLKEVTIATDDLSENVFGVVSDTAGYLMNAAAGDDSTHPPIAMTGRVQVKAVGRVSKGDRLVSAGNGYARSALPGEANSFNTIGRALADKTSDGNGKVLAAVSAKL